MEQQTQTFLEKIEKKLKSPDASKRVKCIREMLKQMELSEDCIVEGMHHLISLLKDKDPWVRKESLRCIEVIVAQVIETVDKDRSFKVKYGGKMVPVRKLLFYQAIQLTKDPDPEIRLEAVRIAGEKSLEYQMIREKATPFLMARIKDENKDVRNAAISYIIKITQRSPELTRPLLMRLYKGHKRSTDVYVTYILDKVMIKHQMPEFVPLFFDKLDDADINTEKYILSALVKCGVRNMDELHDDLVYELTDKADMLWWVSTRNMLLILEKVAEKNPEAIKPYLRYILPLLSEENREVRRVAVDCVGKVGAGDPDRVKEAIAILVDLVMDPDDKVKESAYRALYTIGIKDPEFKIVRKASRSLNKARLTVMDLKKNEDLTDRIRQLYVVARKAFTARDYERSLEYSIQAIIDTRTRNELRGHAQEAIQAADEVVDTASQEGFNTQGILSTITRAKRAFEDRKYFLAHELIYKSKKEAGLGGPSGTIADPYSVAPGMESKIETMVCHLCGERISKGNTNCPGCGGRLDTTSCTKCNAHVLQGLLYCAKCGEHLDHVCEVCGAINQVENRECEVCGNQLGYRSEEVSDDHELDVELIPTDLGHLDIKNVPK